MPKYKVGDVLKIGEIAVGIEFKVRAVIGELYGLTKLTSPYNVEWRTEEELDAIGYTIAQSARWVPEEGELYWFLDMDELPATVSWQNGNDDQFRLSIGNVFKVGDHAGIEALKRKWQEGNK